MDCFFSFHIFIFTLFLQGEGIKEINKKKINAIYAVYSCPYMVGERGWWRGGRERVTGMFSSLVHNNRTKFIQFKHIKLKGRAKGESRSVFGL